MTERAAAAGQTSRRRKGTNTVAAGGAIRKKAPRIFRLDPALLAAAGRALGTPNDTATIEAALDLVVFREEVRHGIEALAGLTFAPFDEGDEQGNA